GAHHEVKERVVRCLLARVVVAWEEIPVPPEEWSILESRVVTGCPGISGSVADGLPGASGHDFAGRHQGDYCAEVSPEGLDLPGLDYGRQIVQHRGQFILGEVGDGVSHSGYLFRSLQHVGCLAEGGESFVLQGNLALPTRVEQLLV